MAMAVCQTIMHLLSALPMAVPNYAGQRMQCMQVHVYNDHIP